MQVERIAALSINVPEWFARPDFQAWLNAPNQGLATWHALGAAPSAASDTFITFDHRDGSDFNDLFPPDLHSELCEICEAHGLSYGILRLTNLEEAEPDAAATL
jgi:hypothetical protein